MFNTGGDFDLADYENQRQELRAEINKSAPEFYQYLSRSGYVKLPPCCILSDGFAGDSFWSRYSLIDDILKKRKVDRLSAEVIARNQKPFEEQLQKLQESSGQSNQLWDQSTAETMAFIGRTLLTGPIDLSVAMNSFIRLFNQAGTLLSAEQDSQEESLDPSAVEQLSAVVHEVKPQLEAQIKPVVTWFSKSWQQLYSWFDQRPAVRKWLGQVAAGKVPQESQELHELLLHVNEYAAKLLEPLNQGKLFEPEQITVKQADDITSILMRYGALKYMQENSGAPEAVLFRVGTVQLYYRDFLAALRQQHPEYEQMFSQEFCLELFCFKHLCQIDRLVLAPETVRLVQCYDLATQIESSFRK